MDWLEKMEQKKKIRKLAGRMLWKDVKVILLGWKVMILLFLVSYGLMFGYVAEIKEYNIGAAYFLIMMALMMLYAAPEQVFYFLPMTQKEIRQYLSVRTNFLSAGMVTLSVGMAAVLTFAGVEVFWERGLMSLLAMLCTLEGMTALCCYDYREEEMKKEELSGRARARRRRAIFYVLYGIVVFFYVMLVMVFADEAEHPQISLYISMAFYVSVVCIRKDVLSWTEFREYKRVNRNLSRGHYSGVRNGEEEVHV